MLRGSSPQEGDPLGIYPGGGLDSRIDPALVPEARAQLGDEVSVQVHDQRNWDPDSMYKLLFQVRLLQTQLEILTRRLGVSSRGRGGGDATLDAGLLLWSPSRTLLLFVTSQYLLLDNNNKISDNRAVIQFVI